MEIIKLPLWLWYLILMLVGLCIGYFLNVAIDRIPGTIHRLWQEETDKPDNKKNSLRYLIVKILTALMVQVIMISFSSSFFRFGAFILIFCLIVLAFIDLETKLLPDIITLPLLWCGIIFNLNGFLIPLNFSVLGAVFGYISLWLIYWIFKLVTKKEGMGYGDFKLMAALGSWLGVEAVPILMLLSSSLAIIFYTIIWFLKKKAYALIAFGPYLALSGGILLFFHSEFIYFIEKFIF